MRPLIETAVWGERGDARVNPIVAKGSPYFLNKNKALTGGVNGVNPKTKFQAEEYKNTHIIGRIAPYIGFGRKGVTRVTPMRNRLFFLNSWGDPRSFLGAPRVHPSVTPIFNLLKSLIFSSHWGAYAMQAAEFLSQAQSEMEDRASTYDKPQGERSMAATVVAFNAMTGHRLTEEQGWKFMVCLKLVRSEQGDYRADNFVDGAAYFGLAGEASSKRTKDFKSILHTMERQ